MESIDFIDEAITKVINERLPKSLDGFLRSRYDSKPVHECFDKIVEMVKNYDSEKPAEFTAIFNHYKYRNNIHESIVSFPLFKNGLERYIGAIKKCNTNRMLVIEWEDYLKSKGMENFPMKLIAFAPWTDFTSVPYEKEKYLVFDIDRHYKSKSC